MKDVGSPVGRLPHPDSVDVIRKCRACGDGFPEEWLGFVDKGS